MINKKTGLFRLGDIFEKLPVKKAKKRNLQKTPSNEYCVPVVYAKYGDNGIMYWGKKNEFTTYPNVISIVYNGVISAGKVYAQERATGVLAESYLIRYKNNADIPFEANFYIATVIEHTIYPKYSRENLATWNNKVENEYIELPVVEGTETDIDFEYMKETIRSLQDKNICILKEYISQHAMENTELAIDENSALEEFLSNKKAFKKFKLGGLFVASTGDVDLQQKDINGAGTYFINSGIENNGIKGKTDTPAKVFPANTITIDFWGNAFYRDFEYKLATHNHVFSLQGDMIKNKYVGLFIVGAMAKLSRMFSFDNMATWPKLQNVEIYLPVKDASEVIDIEYMETYMKATEKKSLRNVLQFVNNY